MSGRIGIAGGDGAGPQPQAPRGERTALSRGMARCAYLRIL